jgi:hypothetical protein
MADLENKLLDFRTYFNNHRTQTSLAGRTPDAPVSRPIPNLRSFRWQPYCRALIRCFPIAVHFADPIVSLPPDAFPFAGAITAKIGPL